MPVIVRCALCGADSQQNVLSSTSFFGPRDLDMRPNGPARWALQFMVQRCPACGYCAERIGELTGGAGAVVASLIYRDVLDNARMPELARRYFCAALVAEADERRGDSARRFIDAAWACDDDGAAEQARICRERAAEMLSSAIEWGMFRRRVRSSMGYGPIFCVEPGATTTRSRQSRPVRPSSTSTTRIAPALRRCSASSASSRRPATTVRTRSPRRSPRRSRQCRSSRRQHRAGARKKRCGGTRLLSDIKSDERAKPDRPPTCLAARWS